VTRSAVLVAVAAVALVAVPSGRAHGTIAPASGAAGSVVQFELTVPNDRLDAEIVGVAIEMPPGFELEAATAAQPLWSVSSRERAVAWRGGPIASLTAETFRFSARLPREAGRARLTLVEAYDDGESAPFAIGVDVTEEPVGSDGEGDALALAALVAALVALVLGAAALAVALSARRRSSGT
jgi:uncharacterized protein YcnI